jgi:hypothetical protein
VGAGEGNDAGEGDDAGEGAGVSRGGVGVSKPLLSIMMGLGAVLATFLALG